MSKVFWESMIAEGREREACLRNGDFQERGGLFEEGREKSVYVARLSAKQVSCFLWHNGRYITKSAQSLI